MDQALMQMLAARQGHFRYESGYHSDLWLDLDLLFVRPRAVRPFVVALAARLARHGVDAVCGPLVGGALIAQIAAEELDADFFFAERIAHPERGGFYPVEYRLPAGLRRAIRGKTVAVLDDVISAGSAVRGTAADVQACGAAVAVVGALLVLGDSAPAFFAAQGVPAESVARRPSNLWPPEACPLCRAGVPLEDVTSDAVRFGGAAPPA